MGRLHLFANLYHYIPVIMYLLLKEPGLLGTDTFFEQEASILKGIDCH
jgi:hypothetical protein